MIRINKLILENFQSHKYTELEFSDNYNCFVGPTNAGKSSIIRAINFLFYNDWYHGFLRNGEKTVRVTAYLSNNNVVVREKGESTNIVKLNNTVYQNFGTTLPKEVIDAFGTPPIELGGTFLNISQQDDPPFLLRSTGPAKAQAFGQLAGLNLVDSALKELSKDRRNLSIEKHQKEERIDKIKAELKNYEGLDSLKERVDQADKLLKQINELQIKQTKLTELHQKWDVFIKQFDKCTKLYDELEKLDTAHLEMLFSRLKDVILRQKSYEQCISSLMLIDTQLKEISDQWAQTTTRYIELLLQKKYCPICLSPVKEEQIERIISTL
jgi:exonuclease SbcC